MNCGWPLPCSSSCISGKSEQGTWPAAACSDYPECYCNGACSCPSYYCVPLLSNEKTIWVFALEEEGRPKLQYINWRIHFIIRRLQLVFQCSGQFIHHCWMEWIVWNVEVTSAFYNHRSKFIRVHQRSFSPHFLLSFAIDFCDNFISLLFQRKWNCYKVAKWAVLKLNIEVDILCSFLLQWRIDFYVFDLLYLPPATT